MMRNADLQLVPVPKRLTLRDGAFNMEGKRYIRLDADEPQLLLSAAKKTGLEWEITASPRAPKDTVGLVIRIDDSADIHMEGYKLAIRSKAIEIVASTPVGAFYGACTLGQIVRQCASSEAGGLPCLSISDWPDFPARGVILDISRDKVPTMETLYHLVDLLAGWKINQFQLYTEHTFAYPSHPVVWEHASPMTAEEIMALEAYCHSQFIELVPNQNSFGHMERWLKHDEYHHLAECPDGFYTPWGDFRDATSLNPIDKGSVRLIESMYDELLPHFTSLQFNVGCDETWELGQGKSKRTSERKGKGRVYLDFLLEIHRLTQEHGRTMQFWGDIILHHPELIPELPRDLIALEWGYDLGHPFADRAAKFKDSGVPFYVCPGTSGWNSLSGRTENAIGNITSAAKNGAKLGAIGLLNTDWGDNGHWQPLPVSYLGYMVGAMSSWNAKADVRESLARSLSLHAFQDRTGKMGQAFHDLGNVYQAFTKRTHNRTMQWQILFRGTDGLAEVEEVDLAQLDEAERRVNEAAEIAKGERMICADADIVRREFEHLLRMVRLAVDVGRYALKGHKPKQLKDRLVGIANDHETVWLLRNRPGGLADSKSKLRIE